jgi:electron transfer flavoprotein beta subunit
MNIAVCINHVPDTATKIRINASGNAIDQNGVSFVLNPYDEFALEEALRLKDETGASVKVISVGKDEAKESIRKALALGADEGILLKTETPLDSYATAKLLAEEIKASGCTLVFTGKQSVDFDDGIVGQMIAEFLGFNCVSICVSLSFDDDDNILAEREIEGGKEIVQTRMPAVITAQKGLNEPRYASLKGIMAAKKKVITEVPVTAHETKVLQGTLKPVQPKNPGRILGSDAAAARELVQLLRNEVKII